MTLENLSDEIFRLTAIDRNIEAISRNMIIYFGENISNLEKFFNRNEFAVSHKNLASFWRWIDLSPEDEMEERIKSNLVELFSLEEVKQAFEGGVNIHVITHTIQVFLVFDLPSPEAPQRLSSCIQFLQKVIQELGLQGVVKTIGIFSIKRLDNGSVLWIDKDEFVKLYEEIRKDVDKIFLLHYQNGRFLIKSNEEWNTLISILLFYLAMWPTQDEGGKYHEDLARHHGVSAFAAKKFVLPIQEIAKYVFLLKGSELLEETYFQLSAKELEHISRGILSKIMCENPIESEERFTGTLLEKAQKDLLDPISGLESTRFGLPPEDIVRFYEKVVNKLGDYFRYNQSFLQFHAQKLNDNYTYSLTAILDNVINSTKGAISVAFNVMEKLSSQLKANQPAKIVKIAGNEDVEKALANVKEETIKYPSLAAIIVRLIPFLIIGEIFLLKIYQWNIKYQNKIIFGWIVITFGTILGSLIYWHLCHERFENALIHLDKLLKSNWQQRLKDICQQLYIDLLPDYINKTESFKQDIEKLRKRMQYLFEFARKRYEPEIALDNSFWQNIVQTKQEMEYFEYFVKNEFIYQEPQNILQQHFLRLWWRVSEGTTPLNQLEWEILTKAALRLIPYSTHLLDYSICNYLNEHSNKKNDIKNQLRTFYSPFIMLDPNFVDITNNYAIVYWKKTSCEKESIVDEILNSLETVTSKIKSKNAPTAFSFSVFSMQEGIDVKSLLR